MTQIQSLDYKVPTVKEAKKTKVDNVEYDKLIEMFVLNWGALERKEKRYREENSEDGEKVPTITFSDS